MKTWQKLKANPKLLEQYLIREKVVDGIRIFFKRQGFHEVQTPLMIPVPSCEPNLEVFVTKLTTASGKKKIAYLSMSPEYSIKKLLAAGVGSCFEITRAFRNAEEVSPQHNSEFTILEWYRTPGDYEQVMVDFENLFVSLAAQVKPGLDLSKFGYQNQTYDISLPWTRVSVAEAFATYADIKPDTLINETGLKESAKAKGYQVTDDTSWEEVFYQIYFNEIEPELNKLHKPFFLYDYPLQQASLSRKKLDDQRFAERFEVFMAGLELGNCFSELGEAMEQEKRFKEELKEREDMGKTKYSMDKDLIEALKAGFPQTGGIAVGVDRLIMLMADVPTIAETLFFPTKELFDL